LLAVLSVFVRVDACGKDGDHFTFPALADQGFGGELVVAVALFWHASDSAVPGWGVGGYVWDRAWHGSHRGSDYKHRTCNLYTVPVCTPHLQVAGQTCGVFLHTVPWIPWYTTDTAA
jgi:hypothetical protein